MAFVQCLVDTRQHRTVVETQSHIADSADDQVDDRSSHYSYYNIIRELTQRRTSFKRFHGRKEQVDP